MKCLLILAMMMLLSTTKGLPQNPKKAETIELNGTNIYYEIYGEGEPLFLLHGFTHTLQSWYPFVSEYANDYEVYLVDLKGHGKSGPFKEKLSLKSAGEDFAALIRHLKIESINAIGYSYGGDVLFQLELLNPGLIKSIIVIGTCGSWNAKEFPDWVELLSYKNVENLPWMREQQLNKEQIKSILEQIPNYNVSLSDIEMKSIRTKTLFVIGDNDDGTSLECVESARKNLPDSYLWIVPNIGHRAHMGKNKDDFIRLSKEFFSTEWTRDKQ